MEKLVTPCTILDQIISGNVYRSNKIADNPEHFSTLELLFSYSLNPSFKKLNKNQYIFNTFDCFRKHKQEIIVSIGALDSYCLNKDLLSLLFTQIAADTDISDETQNLIKPEVFVVFPNITELEIYCSSYSFSLLAFLSIIDGTKIDRVEIMDAYSSWLPSIKSSCRFVDICDEYEKANFKLQFDDEDDPEELTIIKNNV